MADIQRTDQSMLTGVVSQSQEDALAAQVQDLVNTVTDIKNGLWDIKTVDLNQNDSFTQLVTLVQGIQKLIPNITTMDLTQNTGFSNLSQQVTNLNNTLVELSAQVDKIITKIGGIS